jgi:sulfur carrier protein
MTIRFNDQPREVAEAATLHDLLCEAGLTERRGLAAAVNNEVVPRVLWSRTRLNTADRVLVIQATQGG